MSVGGVEEEGVVGPSGRPQLYCVKWTDFESDLGKGVRSLFLEKETAGDTDVTLVAEGKYIHAHKMLLALCSPYFKNLFRAQKNYRSADTLVIVNNDIEYEDLEKLVHFMYNGIVKVANEEELHGFLRAGELLGVEGLQRATDFPEGEEPVLPAPQKIRPIQPRRLDASFCVGIRPVGSVQTTPSSSVQPATAASSSTQCETPVSALPIVTFARSPARASGSKAPATPATKETGVITNKSPRRDEQVARGIPRSPDSAASSNSSARTVKVGTGNKRMREAELGGSSRGGRSRPGPSLPAIPAAADSVNWQDLLHPQEISGIGLQGDEGDTVANGEGRLQLNRVKTEAQEVGYDGADETSATSDSEKTESNKGMRQSEGTRAETSVAAVVASGLNSRRATVAARTTVTVPTTRDAGKMKIVLTASRDFEPRLNNMDRALACVWDFFRYETNSKKSVCSFCKKKLAGRRVSNIRKHLERQHKQELRRRLFPFH